MIISIRQVLDNLDLMLLVASFLTKSGEGPLILRSPTLPLILSFRSLWIEASRILKQSDLGRRGQNSDTFFINSNTSDYVTSASMMQWAEEMGCDFRRIEKSLCMVAARMERLDVLELVRSYHPPYPWSCATVNIIVEVGNRPPMLLGRNYVLERC
jgi:hypothetical protein